jgi:hypothetical protein
MSDASTPAEVQVDPAKPERHLFQISPLLDENRDTSIQPVYISLGLEPSAFPAELGGFTDPAESPYAARKGVFDTIVRGAGAFADRMWIFRGDSYLEYFEGNDGKDIAGEFKPIEGNWNGFPPSFTAGIDAVMVYPGESGITPLLFFKGPLYQLFDLATGTIMNPAQPISSIAEAGVPIPESFFSDIDAALDGRESQEGLFWLFKGSEYVQFSHVNKTMDGPFRIADGWPNWPEAFADGVDAAFHGTGQFADHIYFFRGDKYIRYDPTKRAVVEGPSQVAGSWPLMQRFMPLPQLYLVEQYSLRTFHGDMGVGDPVDGGNLTVIPHSKKVFTIITKKRDTTIDSSSTNILESGSDQATKGFSDALKTDESQSGSQDQYSYGMDASFHGEAHATSLTGGEVDANLHVAGQSQDVRTGFATAVGKQCQRQATQTHESRKQRATTEESGHVLDEQTETGFSQTIENVGDEVGNYLLFQITQEYILVLNLIDAQLAFHNGNGRQSKIAAIQDMPALLEHCLPESDLRIKVAAAVVAATTSVIDVAGQVRTVLTPDSTPTDARVNRTLTSTYELRNTAGELVRVIEVPGIIISVNRPVVLTTNTAMAPLGLT